MTIRVRALESDGLMPKVTVLGKNDQVLPATVLINGGGLYVVQVSGVAAHETVTVGVAAADASGLRATGNYRLLVDFNDEPVQLDPVVSGVLSPNEPIQESPLYVALPQLFHFALEVPQAAAPANAAVVVSIRDANNAVVFRVVARAGETRTAGSVQLKPGAYTVQVLLLASEPLPAELGYTLLAKTSSEPFAADPDDPTFQPEFQCDDPEHAGLYCYPGHFTTPDPYLWGDFTETVPEAPPGMSFQEWVEGLLADWWSWVWQQMGVNGPPLAQRDTFSIAAAGTSPSGAQSLTLPANVLDNDIEPEEDDVVAVLRSTASHGSLTLNPDGTVEYTPDDGFEGVDSFTYVASDSLNESREATVRIYVGFRGDYDASGAVDGHDFLAWQQNVGQVASPAGSGADGDGDGVVTAADGTAWAYNFGAVRPEPPAPIELPLEASIGVEADEQLVLTAEVESSLLDLHEAASYAAGGATAPPRVESLDPPDEFILSRQLSAFEDPLTPSSTLGDEVFAPAPMPASSTPGSGHDNRSRPPAWDTLVDHALDELFDRSIHWASL